MLRYYRMMRLVDATGNSGTGHVADVVVGGPGTAIVLWSEDSNALGVSSTVVYTSLDDLIAVHGHNGQTVLEEAELSDAHRAAILQRLEITKRKIAEVCFGGYGTAIGLSGNFA